MNRRSAKSTRSVLAGAATAVALVVAGCMASDNKSPPASSAASEGAAVTRRPLDTPAVPVPVPPPAVPTKPPALAVTVPPDALYVCVIQRDGALQQTAIEFAPKVGALCGRHPEMGPCQYERNNCRARGGRVFAAGGTEITMATEAEYDKKVMRTRFRAN